MTILRTFFGKQRVIFSNIFAPHENIYVHTYHKFLELVNTLIAAINDRVQKKRAFLEYRGFT